MANIEPTLSKGRQSLTNFLKHTAAREMLAEFFGTLILVAFGDAATAAYVLRGPGAQVDVFAICFCWGIGALIGITVAGGISGGHINPAVTVAMACLNKLPWSKVTYYLVAQYLGGLVGAFLVYVIHIDGITHLDGGVRSAYGTNVSTGMIFATYPSAFVTVRGAFIDQVVGTAFLVYAALAIGEQFKNMKTPQYLQPLSMGLVIATICLAFGLNCGSPLNPARDLAPRIFTSLAGYGWEPFQALGGNYWWIGGLVGPHFGAIVGAYLYNVTIDLDSLDGHSSIHPVSGSPSVDGSTVKNDLALESVSTEKSRDQTKEIALSAEEDAVRMRNC